MIGTSISVSKSRFCPGSVGIWLQENVQRLIAVLDGGSCDGSGTVLSVAVKVLAGRKWGNCPGNPC